jgi:hypothetical protein
MVQNAACLRIDWSIHWSGSAANQKGVDVMPMSAETTVSAVG